MSWFDPSHCKAPGNRCQRIAQIFAFILVSCISAFAASKTLLPVGVFSAKSIYLVNQTNNQKVIEVALDEFNKWGRLTIAKSQDEADLVAVFTRKRGIDKWGNAGFTVMDIFLKGEKEPAFETKKAAKLVWITELPVKSCVDEFIDRVEKKN